MKGNISLTIRNETLCGVKESTSECAVKWKRQSLWYMHACFLLHLQKIFTGSLDCLHKENWVIENRDGRELFFLVILNFELL